MNDTLGRLNGIADIAPPLLPAESNTALVMLILAASVIVLLLLLLTWRRFHSRRGQARRQLRACQANHNARQISNRHAAYEIAAILRHGLGLQQISRATPLPPRIHAQGQRWQTFIQSLHAARYVPADCPDQQLAQLFAEATFWLRRWP
jgi:hypothetical protein